MTRRVEADGDSSAAGRRSAWILRVIVGLIFFILVGGLVSYQERQRRRCDIAPGAEESGKFASAPGATPGPR